MTKTRKAEIERLIREGRWMHVTGSRKNIMQTDYYTVVSDLLDMEEVKALGEFRHHIMTTRLQHCLNVSYYNYKLCHLLHLDAESAARAGLLHDLYHYDTAKYHKEGHPIKHSAFHPMTALENAGQLLELNDKERDMIVNHMFPVTPALPKYAETYVITLVDKYCAVIEFVLPQPSRFCRWVKRKIFA